MPKILKTKKKQQKSYPPVVKYVLSALKGIVFSFICFVIISLFLTKNNSFTMFYKIMLYLIIIFGGFICGYSSHKHIQGRGIINGLLSGMIYSFALTVIILICIQFNLSSNILLIAASGIFGGIIGGIVSANN